MLFVNGYLANGQLTKEYLIQLGVPESKIYIGGMSADSENLAKEVSRVSIEEKEILKKELSISDGITYLYVGRINLPKGVSYLLEAWNTHIHKYPDDNLIIIGNGPLLQEYIKIFSINNSIIFTGAIDYDSIYKYYAIADVFVMPTLEDNWSLVVPEAMACGLPIACSIYNGCYPELVHSGVNGVLFDPLKCESINNALTFFHVSNLKKLGNESIRIEKNFNSDKVSYNIFNSLLNINE